MDQIRILDLNDDVICDILRRVAATEDGGDGGSEGFLPVLKVGAGRSNLDSFALLQLSCTCKRFRSVVCTVLPTRCTSPAHCSTCRWQQDQPVDLEVLRIECRRNAPYVCVWMFPFS